MLLRHLNFAIWLFFQGSRHCLAAYITHSLPLVLYAFDDDCLRSLSRDDAAISRRDGAELPRLS